MTKATHQQKPLTLGVLEPFFGGFYHGEMISAFLNCARRFDVRVIAVRTGSMGEFDMPLADNLVDGWITVLKSVSSERLDNMMADGKPVVSVAFDFGHANLLSVQSDNRGGMEEAVTALIDAGHRHIAFMGYTPEFDIHCRLEGYQRALEKHDIPFRPEYVFVAADYGYVGGRTSADDILAAKIPLTALVAGTDLNAVGAITRFREAGLRVPEDIAVVGYDNCALARTNTPPLASVDQNLEQLAEEAVSNLIEIIRSGKPRSGVKTVPSFFVPRTSSGDALANTAVGAPKPIEHGDISLDYHTTEIGISQEIAMDLISAHFEKVQSLMWLLAPYLEWGAISTWEDPVEQPDVLTIRKLFHYRSTQHQTEEVSCRLAAFPPLAILGEADNFDTDHFIALVPVHAGVKRFGVITVSGRISENQQPGRYSSIMHYLDLMALALERSALDEETQVREARYRLMAEQLEVVSRTSNDGIWEFDYASHVVDWNERFFRVVGVDAHGNHLGQLHSLLMAIHPQDRVRLKAAYRRHRYNHEAFSLELRFTRPDASQIWLAVTGEILFDNAKRPAKMIGSIRDVTSRRKAEEQVRHLAYHDALTGLPNRTWFLEQIDLAIAEHSKVQFAVVLLDLDRFKDMNDSYGHHMGDLLLQFITGKLRELFPRPEQIARFGGDEFLMYIPYRDDWQITRVASRMLTVLSEPFSEGGIEFFVTGSIGVSTYPRDGADAETLVKYADMAMYKAKHNGRNQFHLYSTALMEAAFERLNTENRLRKALARQEFELYYQAQTDADRHHLMGAEALIRWNSTEGVISPLQFIPLAEETGLILPIGSWVLEEACHQIREWESGGTPVPKISVNLSSRQFRLPDFVKGITDILARTGVTPENLCLEITESAAIEDIEFTISLLNELRTLGFTIALDDFGTGYSSLSILQRLPLNYLKIDKSFINGVGHELRDASIVGAIVSMAHSLGLLVIAEGVEDEDQQRVLSAMGCDILQGFLINRPLSADKFREQFIDHKSAAPIRNVL